MSVSFYDNLFVFVIDTDEYSGNFEREMCAYITGRVGACGVGDDKAEIFVKEMNIQEDGSLFDEVVDLPDDNGCCRPCSIWPTPGWFNNGLGGHYRDEEKNEEKALKDHNEAAKKYGSSKTEVLAKFPAYQSVAIFFAERPTEEEIQIMKERAHKFTQRKFKYIPKIKISGFRLINRKTVETEEALPA